MVTLDGFLMEKYQPGLISREEVINKSQDPTTIIQKLAEWEAAQAELAAQPATREANDAMPGTHFQPLLDLIRSQGMLDDPPIGRGQGGA
jgi:hypothetical protein